MDGWAVWRDVFLQLFQISVSVLCDSTRSSEDCFLKASFDVKSELAVTWNSSRLPCIWMELLLTVTGLYWLTALRNVPDANTSYYVSTIGFIKFLKYRGNCQTQDVVIFQHCNFQWKSWLFSSSTKYCQLLSPKFSFNEMSAKCKSKSPWLSCLLFLQ